MPTMCLKSLKNPQCRSFGVERWSEKSQSLSDKNFPKIGFKATTTVFLKLDRFAQINFALCCQVKYA